MMLRALSVAVWTLSASVPENSSAIRSSICSVAPDA